MRDGVRVEWPEALEIFEWDGSWRDLYVFETTKEHWDRLLPAFRAAPFQLEFRHGGEPAPIPESLAGYFETAPDSSSALLSVIVGTVRINAHMFSAAEIEFDLDPREVASPEQFAAVVRFMNVVADTLGRAVVLTPENAPGHPLLVAHPGCAGAFKAS